MLVHDPRVHPPQLERYSDIPLFNTKAVVRQTGVPAPTLRAWERRYGILSPRRGENDYRLYSERDMIMVAWLRERVESGMTISQAIALLRSLEPSRRRKGRGRTAAAPFIDGTPAPLPAELPGRISLEDLAALLVRQCAGLDEYAASHTIAQALAVYPVEDVCLRLFTPVLTEIGRLWANGDTTVTVEHFCTALIRAQIESLFRMASRGESGALVLVGCAPGELHELGALILALFLRRSGLRVAYLGQSIEAQHLIATIAALKPACVVLSAVMPAQAEALRQVGDALKAHLAPVPLFCFGGQAFACDPGLAEGIAGNFLGSDALQAVESIKKKLAA